MAFDFDSLSSKPLPINKRQVIGQTNTSAGGFDFDALPKSPLEAITTQIIRDNTSTMYKYNIPEPPAPIKFGVNVSPSDNIAIRPNTAQSTPMESNVPAQKPYLEALADTYESLIQNQEKLKEQYAKGEINASTRYSSIPADFTSAVLAPAFEAINQIPVAGDIFSTMGVALSEGPKGLGKQLGQMPGYKQLLEANPWVTDFSEAVSPTVDNINITTGNILTLLGTVETASRQIKGGREALQYKTKTDIDGNVVTRDVHGDVVYIENKDGIATYGNKPENYPLIRLNSALADLKSRHKTIVEEKKVTQNAEKIQEILTSTKSSENWWANNKDAKDASFRVAEKVDLSDAVDTNGTIKTRPQQEIFKRTYLDEKESLGFKLLEKEDASVPISKVVERLYEEMNQTNLPQSIVEKAVALAEKKLSTTLDEAGNIKLLELAKEKSAAQNSAKYQRAQKNSNAEITKKTIARAYRLVIEEISKTDIGKVNAELAKLYQELEILSRLDGMKVQGGRLGKYFAQISGNIVGGLAGGVVAGPAGAAIVSVIGGEITSALRGKAMSKTFKSTNPVVKVNETLAKAKTEVAKRNLKVPDKKVVAPASVVKTKAIKKLEKQIADNVKEQKLAIKAKDFKLVAKLKDIYNKLVAKLKEQVRFVRDNIKNEQGFANFTGEETPKNYRSPKYANQNTNAKARNAQTTSSKVNPDKTSVNRFIPKGAKPVEKVAAEMSPDDIPLLEKLSSGDASLADIDRFRKDMGINKSAYRIQIENYAENLAKALKERWGGVDEVGVAKTRPGALDIKRTSNSMSDSIAKAKAEGKTFEEWVGGRGKIVYRGGDSALDTTRGGGRGISVSDKTTAELFTPPSGGIVDEAILPKTAKILRERDIPKALQGSYIKDAEKLANEPFGAGRGLQKTVIAKQQEIVEYARKSGFDAVEFPFENEIRVVKPNILKTRSQLKAEWDSVK